MQLLKGNSRDEKMHQLYLLYTWQNFFYQVADPDFSVMMERALVLARMMSFLQRAVYIKIYTDSQYKKTDSKSQGKEA